MELVKWDEIINQIATNTDVKQLSELRNKLVAYKELAKQTKQSLETQNKIAEYRLRVDRKLGEWSLGLDREQGKRGDLTSPGLGEVVSKKDYYKEIDITESVMNRKEAIASVPEEDFEKHIARTKADKKELTSVGVYRLAKKEEQRSYFDALKKAAKPIPSGLYNVILADVPWKYDFSETDSRAIENQYPPMDLETIKEIKVPAAEDSVLFLWATAPKLEEAISVLNAWGFKYRTCAVWDKEIIGMGYWFRGQHELLLIGIKGKFRAPEASARVSSVYTERRTKHSKKPEYYYDLIENYFPDGKYLELFARQRHCDKWEIWGIEV